MPNRYQQRSHHRKRHFPVLLLIVCALLYFYPAPLQGLLSYTPAPVQEALLDSHVQLQQLLQSSLASQKERLSSWGISLPGTADDTSSSPGSDGFEIHFLNVGEGLSVLVRSDDHSLLYDGGGSQTSSFVVSYLQRQGITSLDYIVASHYDADHLSGLIGALHVFHTDTLMGPDYTHDSKTYTSFVNTAADAGLDITHPTVGTTYTLGSAEFTVLAPSETASESNNNSIVLRISNGSNRFLLTGDAQTESENTMCSLGLPLKCDVLCAGHHGSSNSTSNRLLDAVQPTYAIISVGTNDYGHPHQATLDRLDAHGVTVLRTDQLGTIIARSDGHEITWEYVS
jgi:beta-lactamase superfamily II metal-dependent hydrolase